MTRMRAPTPVVVLATVVLLTGGGVARSRPPDRRAPSERRPSSAKALLREELAARIAERRLLPKPASTARAASGPVCESTGFEATEATCQWEQGWICGSTFTFCVSDHDLPQICTGDPNVDENCCGDNPNPLNGWYTSITSQHCNEPHIDTANPASGTQHLRFQRDPEGGADTGCDGPAPPGPDCDASAFTPSAGPQPIGTTTISFDLSVSTNPQRGSMNYIAFADSETNQRGPTFYWLYGEITFILDPSTGYYYYADYLSPGRYEHFEVVMDPCSGIVNYTMNDKLIYSHDFTNFPFTIERALFTHNNAGTTPWDLDNYTVTRGEPCPTCGDGVVEQGEECEPGFDDCSPRRCIPPGYDGECTCALSECGDGVVEAVEECEPGFDDCSPGRCIPPGQDGECTCVARFTKHVISTSANGPLSVFATDLDGDGDVDVLSASRFDDKIAWYENGGGARPTFTERVISSNADGAESVFATDLDGDGDVDVLSASAFDDKIAWYESDGGSPPAFIERVISTTALLVKSVFATDLDGDGDTDVLSASFRDNKIAWYENDGGSPPTFTERVISSNADGAFSVFATDVDGDGRTDVLSASRDDDKIAWYKNDGGSPPTFTERVISTAANGAASVFATDVDGDGDTDVLSASRGDSKIAWYENDGGFLPTFTERVISTAANDARSVFAADVDGDGDTDVLSASRRDNKIAWYVNDGGFPPTFTERVISSNADGAFSVFATDVDGDGDIDVLSASRDDNKIAWYENTAPTCGDGWTDPGEECDDGGESVTCDEDCTVAECGDGTVNATTGEECDGGLGCTGCVCNADFEPTATPSLDCQPTCGNGGADPGEECDDGTNNSDTEPDACRTDCTTAGCGDGVVDTGEECDDGNVEPGDGCDENCQVSGACCDALSGLCMDRVSPESCQGTHASFHLGVDCDALDPECTAAFGACCRDDLDQPGGIRECRSVSLNECRCPSCEWFKLRSCEEVLAEALCEPDFFPIPALSQWGLAIMTLLLLVVGKVHFGRRDAPRRSD